MNEMQLLLKNYRKRINKVIKGGKVSAILFTLLVSLLVPPFDIYADTYMTNSNIVGCNVISLTSNNGNFEHIIRCGLDNYYRGIGYINFKYYLGSNTSSTDAQRYISIDGTSFETTINTSSQSINLNKPITTNGIASSSNYKLVEGAYDIIQYQFPVESLTAISNVKQNSQSTNQFSSLYTEANYNVYPMFYVPQGNTVLRLYNSGQNPIKLIIGFKGQIDSGSDFQNTLLNIPSTIDVEVVSNVFRYSNSFRFFHVNLVSNIDSNYSYSLVARKDLYVIPIYLQDSRFKTYISTSFAEVWGLQSSLMENIEIIANGSNSTNQSSSELETQKGTFDTTSNSLYNSENAFNTDMNTKLQSINTNFDPSSAFGSKFLQSANWVRTQFGNLTNSTPFGTVLSFSMLLGLSLLIVGKVFK